MPVISKECELNMDFFDAYIPEYNMHVSNFLMDVASRAHVMDEYAVMFSESVKSGHSTASIFSIINYVKIQLHNKLEKEGKELDEKDKLIMKILNDTLPDMIINFCSSQRKVNNLKQMHAGYSRKSRKRATRRRKTSKRALRR